MIEAMNLPLAPELVPLTTNTDGVVVVIGTRVPLATIITEFKQGAIAEDISDQYPSLDLADVYAVISYYLRHQQDVDCYLQQQQKQAEIIRSENERRFASHGLRNRLLDRREAHQLSSKLVS